MRWHKCVDVKNVSMSQKELFNNGSDKKQLSFRFFLEHAVQAAVHVLGCACDNDMSMSVDSEEANADECQAVQEWAFGQSFLG